VAVTKDINDTFVVNTSEKQITAFQDILHFLNGKSFLKNGPEGANAFIQYVWIAMLGGNVYGDYGEELDFGIIPYPKQDVICLGMNYSAHEVEAARFSENAFGGEKPKPVFFSKRVTYSQGTRKAIPSYQGLVDSLDYEVELGVILGKDARNIKAEDAEKYIFGYTVINDVSARNLQTSHRQWYFGKSLDGFTPMGPCIVTANEVSFPPSLEIRCWVNGELRQDSNTARLIHGIPEILETLSAGMTLKAGTIIATGTPAGVGMGFDPPKFLKAGDVVECTIEKIGTLRNTVR
jgi:2-keto-4-pentenoate hydratase/2-oxohepta-3-ene-1,7-dioic acid hydratase in catechol pathway